MKALHVETVKLLYLYLVTRAQVAGVRGNLLSIVKAYTRLHDRCTERFNGAVYGMLAGSVTPQSKELCTLVFSQPVSPRPRIEKNA